MLYVNGICLDQIDNSWKKFFIILFLLFVEGKATGLYPGNKENSVSRIFKLGKSRILYFWGQEMLWGRQITQKTYR